nr:hypothetical protein [Tanacetum cinerariifolium]
MIAYLIKSDASEGFNQIINFLNGSSIKLQALVDKKKVIITESFDDAEGVECLPNEEIFTELARMGYEKPSTELTFYKTFFSSQWKFLIHTILQCMSAKRTSWNEFSSSMTSAIICLSTEKKVGDLSLHFTKYTFPALTQKVFANMRRVGKGFSEVDTPLFEGMLVAQEVGEDVDEVHAKDVNTTGVVAEGAVSDDVNAVVDEPSIPSPTLPIPSPQPSQDIPSTSHVQPTPPQLPQVQPQSPQPQLQPLHDAGVSMNLLQNQMDTCTTLTRRVEHLELDKISQALKITKLKQRVKKLERRNKLKVLKLRRLKKDVVLEDDKDVVVEKSADVEDNEEESKPAKIQEVVDVVTTAKIITEVVTTASDTIIAASTTITVADVSIPAVTIAAAPTLTAAPKEPKPLKKQAQIKQDEAYTRELEAELNKNIDWDEVIDQVQRMQKEDKAVKRYQALKRKPQTEAQAMKNMIIYLRNVVDFKIDYFKGIALKRLNESQKDKAAKKQKLDEEVEELKRHLQIVPNDEDDVYTEATPLALKIITFTTTQLILLVERRYPLTRFTLDQMLNNVRLEVEEESEIPKPITPLSESASEEDNDPEQAHRDKDMQKNLALIAKYKNDNQTGQFGNQKTMTVAGVQQIGIQCFNYKEFGHYAKECRKLKRVKDLTYHKKKMLMCKQAEKGVPLQAEQANWLEDANKEIDEQELEAHYSYMAKNPRDERVALAYLIANLQLYVDKNKRIQKLLKKANTSLAHEMKECKSILAKTSKTLEESNSIRDSCLVALQSKQTEF